MKIVFMGTPEFAVPTLKALHEAGHNIALVIAQPDRPSGRGRKTTPPPVKNAAEELGLDIIQPENVNAEEPVKRIADCAPDIIVVVAFGQILKKRLLEIPRLGCVNLHGSLLPLLRGAAPIQRSVMEGHKEAGVTTMMMARKMDAGDMLMKESIPIGTETTAGDLHDSLAVIGAKLMVTSLNLLSKGGITPEPQDETAATYAAKIETGERLIDWRMSAEKIDRTIRGLSPNPGAYTYFRGKRLQILRSRVLDNVPSAGKPGRIIGMRQEYLEVEAENGRLAILEIGPEGKKAIPANVWANGARLKDGDHFADNPD
ncbi:MAG: methionyl-tRNA formyltransferase [Nitrospinota bacterium]|nr:methionyl-tRNA formyltransferase [Nitrospinota bacterium]